MYPRNNRVHRKEKLLQNCIRVKDESGCLLLGLSRSLFEPGSGQKLRPAQLHRALVNLNTNEELAILT